MALLFSEHTAKTIYLFWESGQLKNDHPVPNVYGTRDIEKLQYFLVGVEYNPMLKCKFC